MKIKDLDQHCGECAVIDYCGNAYGYCICTDERFSEMPEEEYQKYADKGPINPYYACGKCEKDCEGENCDLFAEKRDYECKQIADFVEQEIAKAAFQKTLKQLEENRQIISQEYKSINVNTPIDLEKMQKIYRFVASAPPYAVKQYADSLPQKEYTIIEIAKLTEGLYGNEVFKRFYNLG